MQGVNNNSTSVNRNIIVWVNNEGNAIIENKPALLLAKATGNRNVPEAGNFDVFPYRPLGSTRHYTQQQPSTSQVVLVFVTIICFVFFNVVASCCCVSNIGWSK
uniref:Uncharacterized protein n=1 Tax=Glossina brevipalpis TaxID=37001 RepID=A0A1A9W6Y6_9MUSC